MQIPSLGTLESCDDILGALVDLVQYFLATQRKDCTGNPLEWYQIMKSKRLLQLLG